MLRTAIFISLLKLSILFADLQLKSGRHGGYQNLGQSDKSVKRAPPHTPKISPLQRTSKAKSAAAERVNARNRKAKARVFVVATAWAKRLPK